MHCKECGAELAAAQKFCGSCGQASARTPPIENHISYGRELFRVSSQSISAESLPENHPIRRLTTGRCDIVATDTCIFIARAPEPGSKVGSAVNKASLLLGPVAAIVTGAITSSAERAAAERKNPNNFLSASTYQGMLDSGAAAALPKRTLRTIDVQIKPSIFDGVEHYVKFMGVIFIQGNAYQSKMIVDAPFASAHLPDMLRRHNYPIESVRLKDVIEFLTTESRPD